MSHPYVDHAHTDWAEQARTLKAVRLEAHLRTHGVEAGRVPGLTLAGRREIEAAAGVRRCSDETWRLVIKLLGAAGP